MQIQSIQTNNRNKYFNGITQKKGSSVADKCNDYGVSKSINQQIMPVYLEKQYATTVNFKARNPKNCLLVLQTDAQYQSLIKGIKKELSEHPERYGLRTLDDVNKIFSESHTDYSNQFAWQAINKLMRKAKDSEIIRDSLGKWIPGLSEAMSSYAPDIALLKAEQALDFADFLCSEGAKPLREHPSIKNNIFKLFENHDHGSGIDNARVFRARQIVAEELSERPNLLNDPNIRLDLVISNVNGIKRNDILSYYGRGDNRIMNIYLKSRRAIGGINFYDDSYQIACKIKENYIQTLEASKMVFTNPERGLCNEDNDLLSRLISNFRDNAEWMAKWRRSFPYDDNGKLLRAEAKYPENLREPEPRTPLDHYLDFMNQCFILSK